MESNINMFSMKRIKEFEEKENEILALKNQNHDLKEQLMN